MKSKLCCVIHYSHALKYTLRAGVISRGAQGGGAPLVKILDHFGGAQPPPRNSCIGLAFQSLLTLLPTYFLLLCSIMHCYVVIETFLLLIILYQY